MKIQKTNGKRKTFWRRTRNVFFVRTDLEEIISIYDNVTIIEFMSHSELIQSVTQNIKILNLRNLIQKSLKMMKTFPPKI